MTDSTDYPKLSFKPVDLSADLERCIRFVIDTHICGYGSADAFHEADGLGSERYVQRLRDKSADLPGSAVHLWRDNEIVGQIQMTPLPSDPRVGYISLFYLSPQVRRQGLGALLEAYAWAFLTGLGCQALRLSATRSNVPAWKFYEQAGWNDLGPRDEAPGVNLLHKTADTAASGSPLVINPDDYLETATGREFTPERSREAWKLAYAQLDCALAQRINGTHLYLVMGVQGAGKSRWVAQNLGRLGRHAVVFDAALPARRHREHLLGIALRHGVPVMAIFINAALAVAQSRNASRRADHRVPDEALQSVYGLLEPPSVEEGFVWVQTIE